MTANVTSVTFTNKTAGAKFSIVWLQDGNGGRTLTHGASAFGTCEASMGTVANTFTEQFYEVESDGSTVVGTGCFGSDGIQRGTELAAPATPAASQFAFWGDSTNHILSAKFNNSATVSNTVVPIACTNQVMTALSAAGVFTCSSVANAMLSNATTTPNGQTCTLGSTCNVNSGAAAHSVALNQGNGSALTGVGPEQPASFCGRPQAPIRSTSTSQNVILFPPRIATTRRLGLLGR